ncbi:MAG: ABC transporter ATP-binding protein [Dehalococcoidia bacterium]|nr:ABC transporter ATP-binding protein [Dehalococcoidia bacterium]
MSSSPSAGHVAAPAVSAEGLVFAYAEGGPRALDGLTLAVPAGSRFALLGPNGAGKSTLLSMVNGLRTPEAGALRLFGAGPDVAARRQVGVVFQESCLDPAMTVRETLVMQGRLFGLRGDRLSTPIAAVLATMGLEDRADQPSGQLSGGLKRRLELARAMLHEPRLLLLDEPTVGLDPDSRRRLWDHLIEINRQGTTLLIATNDVAEADHFATDVAFIKHGVVVAQGTPEELKRGLKRDAVWMAAPDLPAEAIAAIAALPGVGAVSGPFPEEPHLHVMVDDAMGFVPALFHTAGQYVRGIRIERSTLEDAYFEKAGSRLVREPVAER